MSPFLLVTRDGPVARVTLNRPDVRNAFNEVLIQELTTWARSAAQDQTIRAVVLGGAGKVFCAGADLEWMSRMIQASHEENMADARALGAMYEALDTLPQVLIGRMQGAALGGGAGLAAVCDVVVAVEDCTFGFTEVKLGILPAVISPYVVAAIGPSWARHYCVTGMRFPAVRAKEIGLIHEVVAADALDDAVDGYVREVLSASATGIARLKSLLREIAHLRVSDVAARTAEAIAQQRVSPEGQEGMRAFLERRQASWVERLAESPPAKPPQ